MAEKFINPYNFISFPPEKVRAYSDTDKHTGVIEYSITTKTPLFIPNSSSETAFKESIRIVDHKSYDFFPTRNWILEKNMRENIMPRLSRAVKCAAW